MATNMTSAGSVLTARSSNLGANAPRSSKTDVHRFVSIARHGSVRDDDALRPEAVVEHDPLLEGLVDLLLRGRHLVAFLEAHEVHLARVEPPGRPRDVDRDVAAPDDEDALAREIDLRAERYVGEERDAAHDAGMILPLHAELLGNRSADRHEHRVESVRRGASRAIRPSRRSGSRRRAPSRS